MFALGERYGIFTLIHKHNQQQAALKVFRVPQKALCNADGYIGNALRLGTSQREAQAT